MPVDRAAADSGSADEASRRRKLARATTALRRRVDGLRFGPPVTHVYNPLSYAARPYAAYLRSYGTSRKRVIFLGMNPGPYGMAQTLARGSFRFRQRSMPRLLAVLFRRVRTRIHFMFAHLWSLPDLEPGGARQRQLYGT